MGRKSSAKSQNQNAPGSSPKSSPPRQTDGKGPTPLVLGAVIVALIGVGMLAFWRPGAETPAASSGAAAASNGSGSAQTGPQANAGAVEKAEAMAKLGPHKQTSLPPVPFQPGYAPPRSTEVVTAAYQFAAEHPEILSYVPCFCGCERAGHQGNHDCFVRQRAPNGDVIAWDEHGVDCAVCIDVATRSRQMHAAGASVRDIRAAVDKEFGALYPAGRNMATPHPH